MNKEEKAAAVAELTDSLKDAESVFAIDYRGISVTGAAELRQKLAEADASFKVVKNRLAKRAASDAGTEGLEELLVGPTALTLIKGDPVTAAKAITGFAREHDVLEYKGGIMDGAPLDTDGFSAISRLPGLDVLHGQLVGITASPLTGLVARHGNPALRAGPAAQPDGRAGTGQRRGARRNGGGDFRRRGGARRRGGPPLRRLRPRRIRGARSRGEHRGGGPR